MKSLSKILIPFAVIFVIATAFSITGLICNSEDNYKRETLPEQIPVEQIPVEQTDDTTFIKFDTTESSQNNTEYIPPKDGSSNKYWQGNKHRRLLNDRECYFKDGLRKRKRDGTGKREGDKQLRKRYGQQRNRRGQR